MPDVNGSPRPSSARSTTLVAAPGRPRRAVVGASGVGARGIEASLRSSASMRQLSQQVPRDYTPIVPHRLLRVVLPVALVTSIAAACGGKAEKAQGSTGAEQPEDSYPACHAVGDCPMGETCEDGVCLPDPPETGPLEDGALTMPVDAGMDGSEPEPAVPCDADNQCDTGFCDLGLCAEPEITLEGDVETGYGAVCDDEYVFPGGAIPAPQEAPCVGGYKCKDDRCRSCESSDECGDELPRGCYIVPGEPGQSCGNMVFDNGWTPGRTPTTSR